MATSADGDRDGEAEAKDSESKADTKTDSKAEVMTDNKTDTDKTSKSDKDAPADTDSKQASPELPAEVKGKLRRLDKLESRYHGTFAATRVVLIYNNEIG